MGLESVRIEEATASSGLTIEAEEGEAHRLREVFYVADTDETSLYLDIKVGTVGITRLPVRVYKSVFIPEPEEITHNKGIFGLIRDLFGADYYVEADEGEDITISAGGFMGHSVGSGDKIVAVYEVISPGIDKTKPMRSASRTYVICPVIYTSADASTTSQTVDLDTCCTLEGLPEIKDGYVLPTALTLKLKALAMDVAWYATGTLTGAYFHIKDMTFELFTPITLDGFPSYGENALGRFDVRELRYISGEDYVIGGGHELSFSAELTVAAGGSGTFYPFVALLAEMTITG